MQVFFTAIGFSMQKQVLCKSWTDKFHEKYYRKSFC